MKIVPYRVLFEPEPVAGQSKYAYSIPTDERLPVELDEDGFCYCVTTHDKGNEDDPHSYYQIAFRIEDSSPFRLDELSLHLDSAIYRNADQQINNDLYCDPKFRNDPDKNLWYQRSRYEWDKGDQYREPGWRIMAENRRGSLPVDCITTAGVFGVVVKRNGVILKQYRQPWVYVLPSSITKDDYLDMLTDLLRLNEALREFMRMIRNDLHLKKSNRRNSQIFSKA